MQVRAQMAQGYMDSRNLEFQHFEDMTGVTSYQNYMNFNTSQQSLMEWIDHSNEVTSSHEIQNRNYQDNDDHVLFKKRISESDLGELHELAVRMMRN
ncbi:hypothetical protein HanOQP8_Chr01g0017981 [Helianthus annuus]|nr:hypothetical protein HanOQP8_Chr01g0017981 [Helianthus annuus]